MKNVGCILVANSFVQPLSVTENPSYKGFGFLKLSEFKQWKSSVKIGQNFKAKMAWIDKK